jgi:hypothetical protein
MLKAVTIAVGRERAERGAAIKLRRLSSFYLLFTH